VFRSGSGARNFRNEQSIMENISVLFPVGNRAVVVLWKCWFTSFDSAQTTFFSATRVKILMIQLKFTETRYEDTVSGTLILTGNVPLHVALPQLAIFRILTATFRGLTVPAINGFLACAKHTCLDLLIIRL
jgi:hypothetical protein